MCWTAAATGLRYAALRYFNACGAHPDGSLGEAHFPETHLIPLVLQVANGQRSEISVFGSDYPTPDGTCIRDYVHVCDLAQAHILALEYLLRGGESTAFNLGSGQGFFRTRGDRGGAPRYRSCNPCRGKGAPQRRPGAARCVLGEGAEHTRLAAALQRTQHHPANRMELAPQPSEGILRNCRKKNFISVRAEALKRSSLFQG